MIFAAWQRFLWTQVQGKTWIARGITGRNVGAWVVVEGNPFEQWTRIAHGYTFNPWHLLFAPRSW